MCLYIVVAIQIQVIPVKEQLKSLNSSENGFVASTGKSINNRVVSDNFVIIRPELLLLLRNVLFFDPYYPDIPRESSFYPLVDAFMLTIRFFIRCVLLSNI